MIKKIFFICLFFVLIFQCFYGYTVRVLKNVDGSIKVIHPAFNSKKESESLEQFLNRVFSKANPDNLTYEDIDSSLIPGDRKDRNFWKKDNGKAIEIDTDKKSIHEAEKLDKKNTKDALKLKLNLTTDEWNLLQEKITE